MKILPRRQVELPIKNLLKAFVTAGYHKKRQRDIVSEFENAFAHYIGVKHSIALPSERMGLSIFLEALNLKSGDEVILSSYNYHVVPAIIQYKGLKPVFVDCHPSSWNIHEELIEEKITSKTKILIATHLYGRVCLMDKIQKICRRHNILLVEDAAHACGAEYHDVKAGKWGDVAFFSFGTGKALVTLGGSMMTTENDELANKMRVKISSISGVSSQIQRPKLLKPLAQTILTQRHIFPLCLYPILYVMNYLYPQFADRMTEDKYVLSEGNIPIKNIPYTQFQAALGMQQLETLDTQNYKRIRHAQLYNHLLKDVPPVTIPHVPNNCEHVGLYYDIAAERVQELRRHLFKKGIDTKLSSMRACTSLKFFASQETCPIAEKIAPNMIELPCFPNLREHEIHYVANTIRKFYGINPIR